MAHALRTDRQILVVLKSTRFNGGVMVTQINSKSRHENRNILRFFVKLRSIENPQDQIVDALVADSSEDGAGLFTESILPIGTKVEIIIDDKDSVFGKVVNRDYLFPDSADIIRLGVHFDKPFSHWPIEVSEN